MKQLRIEAVNKVYKRDDGGEVRAIDNVSLEVERGEFVVLLGPSGCGKTTLLRSVAGLEKPDSGKISIGGTAVYDSAKGLDLPPEHRKIGMVFQSYALWPHLTVFENVAYPLAMRGIKGNAAKQRVQIVLEKVRISHLADQYPGKISGGQQQRVALARAIVCEDSLVLFDEPLSNVDAQVREHLRVELLTMQRQIGFTALYVTHDQHEAMGLATRIAVVSNGRVDQYASPMEIYRNPKSFQIADFVGSINQLEGHVVSIEAGLTVETPIGTIRPTASDSTPPKGSKVVLISRPESWNLSTKPAEGDGAWAGKVKASSFFGSFSEHLIDLGRLEVLVWQNASDPLQVGQPVWCTAAHSAFTAFRQD